MDATLRQHSIDSTSGSGCNPGRHLLSSSKERDLDEEQEEHCNAQIVRLWSIRACVLLSPSDCGRACGRARVLLCLCMGPQSGLDLNPETESKGVRDVEQALEANREPDEANAETEEEAQKTRMWVASPDSEDEGDEGGAHYMRFDK